ncbi:hypothetical protein BDW62DRAFT_194258 [Aspergillus aurantiobrunneus]
MNWLGTWFWVLRKLGVHASLASRYARLSGAEIRALADNQPDVPSVPDQDLPRLPNLFPEFAQICRSQLRGMCG